MNSVSLVGRMTRDPDIKYGNNGSTIARFTVACDRRFKTDGGPTADFISCVAFGKTAEFVEKYFSKGKRIGLIGRIQTGSYKDKDGKTVYTTDIVADNVEFVENKSSGAGGNRPEPTPAEAEGFIEIPDISADEDIPF